MLETGGNFGTVIRGNPVDGIVFCSDSLLSCNAGKAIREVFSLIQRRSNNRKIHTAEGRVLTGAGCGKSICGEFSRKFSEKSI